MLTNVQNDAFETDGFLVLGNVVPLDLINAMRAEAEHMAEADTPQTSRR
jgi:hypothetical protein